MSTERRSTSAIARVRSRHRRLFRPSERRSDLHLDPTLLRSLRGHGSAAGVAVTDRSALTFAAYYASVNVVSSDVAAMPLRVYRRDGDGGRSVAPDHPVDDLLYTTPDGVRSSFAFRQSLVSHALIRGNGYAEIETNGRGQVHALHLLPMGATRGEVSARGDVFYPIAGGQTLPASSVLHLSNFGLDGINGLGTVELFRRGIGTGLAAEETAAAGYANGLRPGGFLKIPRGMPDDAVDNLVESMEGRHGGPENGYRIGLLEDGVEWVPFALNSEDAQFLEQRQFSVVEMARVFRLPPHKIGDYSNSHLANLEESNRDYLATALVPWLIRLEQAIGLRLFTPYERASGYYVKHNMNALLRGNMQSRADFYTKMLMAGMSVNEIRALEEMEPIGNAGDRHFVPVNLVDLTDSISGGTIDGSDRSVGGPGATTRQLAGPD